MGAVYATVGDVINLKRALTPEEMERVEALLPVISAALRYEADKTGRDLDAMIAANEDLGFVAKSVTVDVAMRELMTSTSADSEPLTQYSQSALGYSVSGTYLVPGGGLFIKNTELARLGLKRQRIGTLEVYKYDSWDDGEAD